ncbi:MAG: hypothetical protein K0V04_19175 [Deltaproteobacteria bacterium]|nr:hypothetical protein [Deltaproteobacteria bacterium]
MSFTTFYQDGGVFMHVITLLSGIVATVMVRRLGAIHRSFHDPNQRGPRFPHRDVLSPALILAILFTGLLGSAMGWLELSAALRTVPVDQWPLAVTMGMQVASYTFVWALLCVVPMTIGHGVIGHLETRLRRLAPLVA